MNKLKVNNKLILTPLYNIILDIKNQLHNGKLNSIELKGNNVAVTCVNPDHKGGHESKPSAQIYIGPTIDKLQYGTYHCFTCDTVCSFVHFVAMAFEESDSWAARWLIDNYENEVSENDGIDLEPIVIGNKVKKVYLDESILNNFESFHPYMTQRKISKHIAEVFEVKYDPKTQCLVFPVRDETGKLWMLTRRSVNEKKFIIDADKEKPVYLLKHMIDKKVDKIMVCEGQIDALTACSYGMPCVATIGAISDHQIDLLNKSGIHIIYTLFDNDAAGQRFTKKLMSKISKNILVINVYIDIIGKKDINDLTEDEFWHCVENAENKM